MNCFSAERESWICKLFFSMERIFRVGECRRPVGAGESRVNVSSSSFWGGNIIGFRIKAGYFGNSFYSYGFSSLGL